MSIVVPNPTGMWIFSPPTRNNYKRNDVAVMDGSCALSPTADRAHSQDRLIDVYKLQKSGYEGRATVPMLWDSVQKEVINNESSDIIEILNSDFDRYALNPQLDLAPPHLRSEISKWNDIIYPNVNNGVYRYILFFSFFSVANLIVIQMF